MDTLYIVAFSKDENEFIVKVVEFESILYSRLKDWCVDNGGACRCVFAKNKQEALMKIVINCMQHIEYLEYLDMYARLENDGRHSDKVSQTHET